MIKNDLFYYITFIASIVFIVACCAFLVLFVAFKKKGRIKKNVKKGFLVSLLSYLVLTSAVAFVPYEKAFVSNISIIEGYTGLDGDVYTEIAGEQVLVGYGALTRFATKRIKRISIYNGQKKDEYAFYTDDNYTFIHFDCNFGEEYQNKKCCKVYKPFGSVVYNAYFNFSYETYLKIVN